MVMLMGFEPISPGWEPGCPSFRRKHHITLWRLMPDLNRHLLFGKQVVLPLHQWIMWRLLRDSNPRLPVGPDRQSGVFNHSTKEPYFCFLTGLYRVESFLWSLWERQFVFHLISPPLWFHFITRQFPDRGKFLANVFSWSVKIVSKNFGFFKKLQIHNTVCVVLLLSCVPFVFVALS